MTWVPLGLARGQRTCPGDLRTEAGRSATLVLAPVRATRAERMAWQVACHRGSEAFLPLAAAAGRVDPDCADLGAFLSRVTGYSVVALEPPGASAPGGARTGAAWLRARSDALAREAGDRERLSELVAALPGGRGAIVNPAGAPVAMVLTATSACAEIAARAQAAWPELVASAPWPVFGFGGVEPGR